MSSENRIMAVKLTKEEAVKKVNLKKEEVKKVCLSKRNLDGLVSRVALVIDNSGSMEHLYDNGTIQELIEQILPLAMTFDDNGEMEVWIFSNGFERLENITLDNFYGYVEKNIIGKYYMGGTEYAPVIQDTFKKYMKEDPADIPSYVLFITDGENQDWSATDRAITEVSGYPIFYQFVGVGNESFNYLRKLDEMDGRYVDNANFFEVNEIGDITYDQLLAEFPQWLEYPEVKEMLSKRKYGKTKQIKKGIIDVCKTLVDLFLG